MARLSSIMARISGKSGFKNAAQVGAEVMGRKAGGRFGGLNLKKAARGVVDATAEDRGMEDQAPEEPRGGMFGKVMKGRKRRKSPAQLAPNYNIQTALGRGKDAGM